VRQPCVVRSIPRPDPALAADLARFGVATVHEAQLRTGLLSDEFRPVIPGQSVCGPALTVLCHPGDNLMIHAAIELIQPGDVVVVSTLSPTRCGMVGELIVHALQYRKAAALILDACVRDVAALREMGLPIWCRGVSAAGTVKSTAGWVNVPISCGGTPVSPGDLIVADDDGVVVVPREEAERVRSAAEARTKREEGVRARILRGELSLDFNNLREVLQKQGVRYED
jgi:4-hydroxy-4-methyl-2-oxoglutarate aldolase